MPIVSHVMGVFNNATQRLNVTTWGEGFAVTYTRMENRLRMDYTRKRPRGTDYDGQPYTIQPCATAITWSCYFVSSNPTMHNMTPNHRLTIRHARCEKER